MRYKYKEKLDSIYCPEFKNSIANLVTYEVIDAGDSNDKLKLIAGRAKICRNPLFGSWNCQLLWSFIHNQRKSVLLMRSHVHSHLADLYCFTHQDNHFNFTFWYS